MRKMVTHAARIPGHIHKHLHKPVHIAVGWTSIVVAAFLSLTVITNTLAESHGQYFPKEGSQEYDNQRNSQGWSGGTQGGDRHPCPPQGRNEQPANPSQTGRESQPENQPAYKYQNPQPPAPLDNTSPPPADSGNVRGEFTERSAANPCPPSQDGDREVIDAQRFTIMKQGLSKFTKEVERVKRQVHSLKKKGVTESPELLAALAKLDDIVAVIKDAQSVDDLDEITFSMGDAMQDVQEELQKLYRQSELKRFFAMADKEMAKVNKQYESYARKVKSSKLDLNEALAELRAAVDAQGSLLAQIKETTKSDPSEAAERLHEFFAEMDSIREPAKVLEFGLNLKKGIAQIDRELKEAERTIKNLERQKKDVTELKSLLAQSKEQQAIIKKLSGQKPLPMDEIIDALETLADLREQSSDIFQALTGNTGFEKPTFRENDSFNFHPSQGFDFGQ